MGPISEGGGGGGGRGGPDFFGIPSPEIFSNFQVYFGILSSRAIDWHPLYKNWVERGVLGAWSRLQATCVCAEAASQHRPIGQHLTPYF